MMQTTFRVFGFTASPSVNMAHQRIVVTLWATINVLPIVLGVLSSAKLQHRDDLLHSARWKKAPAMFCTIKFHTLGHFKLRQSFSTSLT